MTKRDAWLIMAEAYETPRAKRTKEQKDITFNGLCYAPSNLKLFDLSGVGADISKFINDCLTDFQKSSVYAYNDRGYFGECNGQKYYINPANDKLRADFCRFQYYRLGGK